jgi:small conductance mechanosensitive channel
MNHDTPSAILTQLEAALPAIGAGLAVILASWAGAALARHALLRLARRAPGAAAAHADVLTLAATAVFWSGLAFGLVIGLGTMGVHVEALVASLGLTGFALGFALRDAISNLLAGVLILAYRPFRYGDRIAVTDFEGVVVNIDLRYTTLEDGGNLHLIPNQIMYSNPVTLRRVAAPATGAAPGAG